MRIDELRDTLHDHADEVTAAEGGDPVSRVGSVRVRVAVARRRRRTTLVAAVVGAVVAGGLAVVPFVSDPTLAPVDAPSELAGLSVPVTQTAGGFTFRYVRGVESEEGEAVLETTVDRDSDELPHLVLWTGATPVRGTGPPCGCGTTSAAGPSTASPVPSRATRSWPATRPTT